MKKLSILLPTFNNKEIIRDCLESVKWADEIFVVDFFSTDRTLDICREYGARIVQHAYLQSAKQKNWAIPQCAHEWILQIDTDEVLQAGAREEIEKIIATAPADLNVIRLPRKNHILGVWVKSSGIYPDYQTRLFRRDAARFQDIQVHAHIQASGRVGTLQHHLLHYGMTSISKQLGNLDRYSRYQADELRARGKRFHWYQLVLRPFAIFGHYYFWKLGWTVGYRGFLIAMINASFDFWAHAKLWELQTFNLPASPK